MSAAARRRGGSGRPAVIWPPGASEGLTDEVLIEVIVVLGRSHPDVPEDEKPALVAAALRLKGFDVAAGELPALFNRVLPVMDARIRLAPIKASLRRMIDEYGDAFDALEDAEVGTRTHEVAAARVLGLLDRIKRDAALIGRPIEDIMEPRMVAYYEELDGLRKIEQEDRVAAEREARLARRAAAQPPDVTGTGTRCAAAGCRKPARVDDLCKVHAYEAGTLPHGKIGEG